MIFKIINLSICEISFKNFFVDGPGGTNKTFLCKCFYHHQWFQNRSVLCAVWTGIAAILLPNGYTAHWIFKLPINMASSEEEIVPIHLDKNSNQHWSNLSGMKHLLFLKFL